MKQNKGNVIILFVLVLITVIILLLLSLKTKIQKGWNNSSQYTQTTESNPTESEISNSLTTNNNLPRHQFSQAVMQPNISQKYEYYNDLSSLKSNEIINPFINSLNKNPPKPLTDDSLNKNINSSPIASNLINRPNLVKAAPNGFPFPTKSGYMMGYPIKNKFGKLNITINNKFGGSNLAVFLYLIKPYSEFKDISLNELISAIYISGGDSFSFRNVHSGYYKIVWLNLANNKVYQSKEFAVFQDNKYAYDRIFIFHLNKSPNQKKTSEIALKLPY